jgi:hypothetical protein
MIIKLLAWSAKRSKDIRVQAALATIYGLISIFGVGPSILIVIKLRKQAKRQVVIKKTVKTEVHNDN